MISGNIILQDPVLSGDITESIEVNGGISLPVQSLYKGATSFTPTESEQTIPIAGKTSREDITIGAIPSNYADVSGVTATAADVRSPKNIVLADGSLVTGTYDYSWMGDEPEFMQKVYDLTLKLSDTGFATWTPSTTATSIRATENVTTFSASTLVYDYILRWTYQCKFVYADGTTLKAAPHIELADQWQAIVKRSGAIAQIEADTRTTNTCITDLSVPLLFYYNTSGTLTYTYAITYGVYPAVTAATFSNSTSNTPTVTVKSPAISARCSSTYFATGIAPEVDQDKTIIRIRGELYRVKAGSCAMYNQYRNIVSLYHNPI